MQMVKLSNNFPQKTSIFCAENKRGGGNKHIHSIWMLRNLILLPSVPSISGPVNSLDLPLLSSPLKPKLSSNSSIQTVQSRATRSNPQLSDVLPKIEEEGGGEGESKSWNECEELISSLNFSLEESNTILRKAFGFKHSPYWGEERIREIPTKETVNFSLNYLRGLGLSDDDLHKLLVKFPEVIGCDLDTELKSNVASLEKEWGIKGKVLRRLLLRNPKVLGFNVDCKGDCFAKCTRCWVRF